MQTVQIFSKLTIFDKRMNKNANKVQKYNDRKLVFLFMHIQLGLPQLPSIIYYMQTSVTFLIFHSILILFVLYCII